MQDTLAREHANSLGKLGAAGNVLDASSIHICVFI